MLEHGNLAFPASFAVFRHFTAMRETPSKPYGRRVSGPP